MSKTQYFVAASLDGFIADAEGGIEWLLAYDGADDVRQHYEAFIANVGALAMGARTYEFLLHHDGPWPYAERPSWVFTHRDLPKIPGANILFHRGAVTDVHTQMLQASNGKNLWLIGGGDLAAQFQQHRLIDELMLTVVPVALGRGAPLLGGATHPKLSLRTVTRFASGLAELHYDFA